MKNFIAAMGYENKPQFIQSKLKLSGLPLLKPAYLLVLIILIVEIFLLRDLIVCKKLRNLIIIFKYFPSILILLKNFK